VISNNLLLATDSKERPPGTVQQRKAILKALQKVWNRAKEKLRNRRFH